MRTSLALIRSLALALLFVAFVCAFATTSDNAINLGELARSKSTQFAHPTDDALAPLQPLIASVRSEAEAIKEVPPMVKWLMRSPMVKWLMQTVVVFVLLHFIIHVPLAPTVLGVCLVLVALLFPSSVLPEASKARIKLFGIDVSFQGGLRLAAIIPGIILIASGAFQGGKGCSEDYRSVYHHEKT
jgi:Flp pilus assembly protein TadB